LEGFSMSKTYVEIIEDCEGTHYAYEPGDDKSDPQEIDVELAKGTKIDGWLDDDNEDFDMIVLPSGDMIMLPFDHAVEKEGEGGLPFDVCDDAEDAYEDDDDEED
jgi:hypothetical protein